jgi:type I restriction enzyme S subunit
MYTIFKTNDSVNDYYLFLVLKTHELIHQYNKRMTWSIDRRWWLRWDEFSKIQVYLPWIKEQEAILLIINQSKIQINWAKEKLANIKLLKKWLMQELLTWKTRIPASYLSN